jgi:hypothetical protein
MVCVNLRLSSCFLDGYCQSKVDDAWWKYLETPTETAMANTTMQKTAVVTGATSGLGEAAASALAKEGYRVLVVGTAATGRVAAAEAGRGS